VIRNNALWLCQQAGIDQTGSYTGDQTGSSVDRSGIRYVKLQVGTSSLTCSESPPIIYDNASSHPYWYYCPSMMVNANGHILFGFSLSKATEYIGAAFYGRTSSGAFPDRIFPVQNGMKQQVFWVGYWGDYSATVLDPSDSSTFWTVQSYVNREGEWATWIKSVAVTPP
jgi:hypothetical protein